MYPCDHQVLDKLLAHIDSGEFDQALRLWYEHRQNSGQGCDACPYDEVEQAADCCMCLEGKLRTLNLYQHTDGGFEHALQEAARKLDAFQKHQRIASKSVA